jgi:hypothetical protein
VFTDAMSLGGRGDKHVGEPAQLGFDPADMWIVGRLFWRGGDEPQRPVSVGKLYDAYSEALNRQASMRQKETPAQRQSRLMLSDAVRAVGAMSEIRRQTPDAAKRKAITLEMVAMAKEAVERAAKGEGTRKFRAAGAQHGQAAKQLESQRLKSAQAQ